MLGVLWSILRFPFRLIGLLVDLLSRTVLILIGLALMVGGAALMPVAAVVGVPLFIVGLLVTLRGLS